MSAVASVKTDEGDSLRSKQPPIRCFRPLVSGFRLLSTFLQPPASSLQPSSSSSRRRGMGLVGIAALMVALGTLTAGILLMSLDSYAQGARLRDTLVADNLLSGAAELAKAELRRNPAYTGAPCLKLGKGEVRITIQAGEQGNRVIITAATPTLTHPRYSEKRTLPLQP